MQNQVTENDRFEDIDPSRQFLRLRRARATADWEAASGPGGAVIIRLRARGDRARQSSRIFLYGLIATVVMGLAFYLLLPFWESYVDARRSTLQTTMTEIETANTDLDRARTDLIERGSHSVYGEGLAGRLRRQFEHVEVDSESNFRGHEIVGGALLIYGSDGAILRSIDGREGLRNLWQLRPSAPIPIRTTAYSHVVMNGTLLIYGVGGAIFRFSERATNLSEVPSGTNANLSGHAALNDILLIYGDSGSILRSTDDGESFEPILSGTNANLSGHAALNDVLLIYGDSGSILRSSDNGRSFDQIALDASPNIVSHAIVDEALLLVDDTGSVLRSIDSGTSFHRSFVQERERPVRYWPEMPPLYSHASLNEALLIYGSEGTILRSTDNGERFTKMSSGTQADLFGHAVVDEALLIYGSEGTILRSTDNGERFTKMSSGTQADLFGHVVVDEALLIYGSEGTILLSMYGGESIIEMGSGTEHWLRGHALVDRELLIYGSRGTVLRATDRWGRALAMLNSDAGKAGDSALVHFLDQALPEYISQSLPIVEVRTELTALQNRRAALEILRGRTEEQIEELDAFLYAQWRRERVRLDLEAFLATCRGEQGMDADLTRACLSAWQERQASADAWWVALADQVPPGILILFLLATLGSLYRYNLRLSGFHDSRADALELLAQGRSPEQLRELLAQTPRDAVDLASIFLAADKVELGAIKARIGQAEVELAKSMRSER